jgi:TolA-binding protein
VVNFISSYFIPAKIHIKEQPQTFKRFGAQWTPTILVMTPNGEEAHRIEGFLGVDDMLAQLELGLGKSLFKMEKYAEAEKHFRAVVQQYPASEAAPQALYWAGVAAYKATNDPGKLKDTALAEQKKYPQSEWAKKASVWAG